MGGCECSLKTVVFNNRTAPSAITHGPYVGYAQRVTFLMSTDVLEGLE